MKSEISRRGFMTIAPMAALGLMLNKSTNNWLDKSTDDIDIEKRIKAIYWKKNEDRLMILNTNVPLVNKNVDLIICGRQN